MAQTSIQARTLKGFRDIEPAQMRRRNAIVASAQRTLEIHAFQPIATPVLEYTEILLGKGGGETDKQIYRFEDGGGRDVAMRYDLTVPLARYVSQHRGSFQLPFKAYQIGLVWRGENAQRGRYREFMQCDFDILGPDAAVSDAEVLAVAGKLVQSFFGEQFALHVNSRGILKRYLEAIQVTADVGVVLRSLDKLRKAGEQKVLAELQANAAISAGQGEALLGMALISGSAEKVRGELANLLGKKVDWVEFDRLQSTVEMVRASGVAEHQIQLDLSIARGLDYYTGLVFETFAIETPEVGSICSGGRYNNLTGLYGQETPGVGGSVGVDRLMSLLEPEPQPSAQVVLVNLLGSDTPNGQTRLFQMAGALREVGVATEIFPESKKLKQQLKYVDQSGAELAVILGPDELERGVCQVKVMKTGDAHEASLDTFAERVVQLLVKE